MTTPLTLRQVKGSELTHDEVDGNFTALRTTADAAAVAAAARTRGVATSVLGPAYARLVTHMGIDDVGVDRAADVLGDILRRALAAGAGR